MKTIQHRFVEFIPDSLEEGILYITIEYKTAVHKCACGCGNKVVTPISPNDWRLIFDGKTVTLKPSIGNWGFDCRSHYWITNNVVEPATIWTEKKVPERKKKKRNRKRSFFLSQWKNKSK